MNEKLYEIIAGKQNEKKASFRELLEKRTPTLHLSEEEERAFSMDDEKMARVKAAARDVAFEVDCILMQMDDVYKYCEVDIEAKDPAYNNGNWYWEAVINHVPGDVMTAAWILKHLEDEEGVYNMADVLIESAMADSFIEEVREQMAEEAREEEE